MPPENDQEIQTSSEPLSLRDTIAANFDAVESANPEPIIGSDGQGSTPVIGRTRDEQGRFAPGAQAAPAAPEATAPAPETQQEKRELTTWKREMRPLQEKLARGEALSAEEATRLAQYNVEREQNYATGISGYKAQAEQAKEYADAMQEFLPLLQQHNMQPGEWIRSLGNAQRVLALGSPQEKVAMFANLAHMYGIPLGAIAPAQQGQYDATTMQLMHDLQELKASVNGVKSWRERQEQSAVQQEIAKFTDASKFPHFERVRGVMAQLLESGLANDPDSAYEKAVRLDGDAWQAEQQRQAADQLAKQSTNKVAAAARARQAAVSIKSSTPAGMVTSATKAGNLRADIEAATEQVLGGGRV